MTNNTMNYDDWTLIMAALIATIAMFGMVFLIKGNSAGNLVFTAKNNVLEITPLPAKNSDAYCTNNEYAFGTKQTVDAVLQLDYHCTPSDIDTKIMCCTAPK